MANNHKQTKISDLRKKLLTAMIIVPAIPFFLVLAIGYYQFVKSLEAETFSRISRIANDHRRVVQMFLDERRSDLVFATDVFKLRDLSQKNTLAKAFSYLKSQSSAYVDLGVFNQKGIHVAYQGPYELEGKSYANAPWFKMVMLHGYYISDVFLGYRKVPHFVVAVKATNGGEVWVLRATIDTKFFTGFVEGVRIGKTGEAYILNDQGMLQTERRASGMIMSKDQEHIKELTPRGQSEAFVRKAEGGHEYVYATAWLNDHKWLLVVRQEVNDAFSSLWEATYVGVIILLIGGAGIVSIAFLLTNSLVMRIQMLDREKEELDQQLIMTSRLAEIGEMSAGFAHEINNPLQVISAEQTLIDTILTDMAQRGDLPQSKDTEEVLDSVAQIRQQVDRCGSITQSILKFARQKDPKPENVDIGEFMGQVADMLRKKAEVNGIDLTVKAQPGLPKVNADPGQLQQVLLNLLNNAFDAVTQRHGVAGGKVEMYADNHGDQVTIRVKDNGHGISQHNAGKIFRPFFSTKPVGKGTGLGLSVCYGIVDKMNGSMEVESTEGEGATFFVKLPATTPAPPCT